MRVSPLATDRDLSFNFYAVGGGKEFSLVVYDGRVTGSLVGTFGRIGQAWTIVESNGQLVLRDLDTTKSPGEPDDRLAAPKYQVIAPGTEANTS